MQLKTRWEQLEELSNKLIEKIAKRKLEGHEKIGKFPELAWAILQHYEKTGTPLLDLTTSLRVAASFALSENTTDLLNERRPIVAVFALPHPIGSISYSVEEELLNVKLISICTPKAHRPFFQEGYLVGSFPIRSDRKYPHFDFARRLIAKFELRPDKFWSDRFPAIPKEALYPDDDPMMAICGSL